MRKEPYLPYWMNLERVIPVVQTQTASSLILTLVSVELYTGVGTGFLSIFNGRSVTKKGMSDRGGRGWMRAHVVDDLGKQYQYSSNLTLLSGIEDTHGFRGRAVMKCTPSVDRQASALTITIDVIEWEFVDGDQPPFQMFPGPWEFHVSLA